MNRFRPALDLCVYVSPSLSLSLQIVLFLKPPLLPPATSFPHPFLLCTSCRVKANISSRILPTHSSRNYRDVLPNGRCCRRGSFCTGAFSKICPARLCVGPGPRRVPSPGLPLPWPLHPASLPCGSSQFQPPVVSETGSSTCPPLSLKLGFLLGGTCGKPLRKSKESSS